MDAPPAQRFAVFKNGPAYRDAHNGELNAIDFSSYKELHGHFHSHNFSVKYVTEGIEYYNIHGTPYTVKGGEYFLGNAFTQGEATIDSSSYVKGVCIEISPSLLTEVVSIAHDPANPYPEKDFYQFLTTATFFEHHCKTTETRLGQFLQYNAAMLSPQSFSDQLFAAEFFYGLAGTVVADMQEVYRYFTSFDSIKGSTKKDLLARLLKGKEWIDEHYADKLSITEIAQAATMSEYYFLRLFTQVFGSSPHRYLINTRLEKSVSLLRSANDSITDIAYSCGFSDVHSFAKAFRKKYGHTPGVERRKNKRY